MIMSKKHLTFYGIYGYQVKPCRIVANTKNDSYVIYLHQA